MKKFLVPFFCLVALVASSQNQNLSNGVVFDGEPFIAQNPNNSQHIVVAWMGWKLNNILVIKTRVSFDAGQTWSAKVNIPHITTGNQSADPSLAFDNSGNLYLSFVDYKASTLTGGVYITKSTDGGLTWGTATESINANADGVQYPVDRPWMSVDISGTATDGNIYITTMNPAVFGPVPPPYNPYFIRSTDGGTTFSPWKHLDTTAWLAGSLIPQPMPTNCVSSNGTFHAIYPSLVFTQSPPGQYIIASSADAGNSFNHYTALTILNGNSDTLPKKGYKLIADPSNPNHLLFAYPGFDNGDIDVYTTESFNGGISWNTPERVNDDPIANNRMQDLIWADFDNDGDVVITWRDRRNASDSTYTVSTEIYGAVKWKGNPNYSPNFMISDSAIAYNSILANSGNDFMCVTINNDSICAVWGDTRNGFLNIWFNKIDASTLANSIVDLANDVDPINIYPNPAKELITINLGENELKNSSIQLLAIDGKLISTQKVNQQNLLFDLSAYPTGVYFIQFHNDKGNKLLKMVKE